VELGHEVRDPATVVGCDVEEGHQDLCRNLPVEEPSEIHGLGQVDQKLSVSVFVVGVVVFHATLYHHSRLSGAKGQQGIDLSSLYNLRDVGLKDPKSSESCLLSSF
jgi:hypothetical protein